MTDNERVHQSLRKVADALERASKLGKVECQEAANKLVARLRLLPKLSVKEVQKVIRRRFLQEMLVMLALVGAMLMLLYSLSS